MRPVAAYFSLLVLIAFFAGCAPATEPEPTIDPAAAEKAAMAEFQEMLKAWDSAVNAGDVEALGEMWTDDYIRMMQDIPAVEGKQAVIENAKAFFEENDLEDAHTVIAEVRLAGDWAFLRGTATDVRTPKATGEPINISGKWMEIWERQADGTWKIARTVNNLDAPLPE